MTPAGQTAAAIELLAEMVGGEAHADRMPLVKRDEPPPGKSLTAVMPSRLSSRKYFLVPAYCSSILGPGIFAVKKLKVAFTPVNTPVRLPAWSFSALPPGMSVVGVRFMSFTPAGVIQAVL